MRVVQIKTRERQAFTLVELLVVIAIIGVLISLLLAAVMKALNQAEVAQTRSDISQLSQAISAWQVKFGVKDPFPSRLMLCEDFASYNMSQPIAADSVAFLQRVWPRITTTDSSGTRWASGKIDWSGGKKEKNIDPTNTVFILQGQECLVFFLGGIPTGWSNPNGPFGCMGFSTSPTNPAAQSWPVPVPPGITTIPPFFSFDSSRLRLWLNPRAGARFFAYLDPYGKKPYAYFSSYKNENGYNRYGATDCPNIVPNGEPVPWPYAEAPGRYLNPNTFQIISAGRDGKFGPGTDDPSDPLKYFVRGRIMKGNGFNETGYDDMSNFHDKFLGIPND